MVVAFDDCFCLIVPKRQTQLTVFSATILFMNCFHMLSFDCTSVLHLNCSLHPDLRLKKTIKASNKQRRFLAR